LSRKIFPGIEAGERIKVTPRHPRRNWNETACLGKVMQKVSSERNLDFRSPTASRGRKKTGRRVRRERKNMKNVNITETFRGDVRFGK